MRYALIGCGRISPNHIAAALKNNLEICAVCDIKEENIEVLLTKFELGSFCIKRYTDYKEMIEKEKPELVAIAMESGIHAEIALHCIRHDIHVITEKSIAMNMKDARMICEEAEKHHVVVCANHQNRFNKSIKKIREAVEEGRFGRLLHGTAHIRWRGTWV